MKALCHVQTGVYHQLVAFEKAYFDPPTHYDTAYVTQCGFRSVSQREYAEGRLCPELGWTSRYAKRLLRCWQIAEPDDTYRLCKRCRDTQATIRDLSRRHGGRPIQIDALTLLNQCRDAGIEVSAKDGFLYLSGPLHTEALAREVMSRKSEMMPLLDPNPFAELDDLYVSCMPDSVFRHRELYVYVLPPIDIGWQDLTSVEAKRQDLFTPEAEYPIARHPTDPFVKALDKAQQAARRRGWDGTYREPPRVFYLPDPDYAEFVYGFVWKQDNNGTTFVVSPKRLSWLEETNS